MTVAVQVNTPVYKIDVGRALEYRVKKHMSYADIGKMFGVSAAAIHKRLRKFTEILDEPEIIQAHDNYADQLLSGAMCKMLASSVDAQKVKDSSTRDLCVSYGILFDKQRLLRGQATAIVSNVDLTPEDREQLRFLEAKIIEGETQDVVLAHEITSEEVVNT